MQAPQCVCEVLMQILEMTSGVNTELDDASALGRRTAGLIGLPGRQVLIVEGNARTRDQLERSIRDMGFAATGAGSAETALRYIEQRRFDILVFDVDLPGMNGLEMLHQLRKHGSQIQAILLASTGDLETARKAIHLEVVDYLNKPCSMGSLERALERARARCPRPRLPEIAEAPQAARKAALVAPKDESTTSLEEIEQRHILAVLNKNGGRRNATAAELGISLRKLYYRLGQYQRQGLLP